MCARADSSPRPSVLVADADAVAYGARSDDDGRLDRHRRRRFRSAFRGTTTGIDLRRVPADRAGATGREPADLRLRRHRPLQRAVHHRRAPPSPGRSSSAPTVGAGTVGSIDTLQKPLHFTGDGDIDSVNLRRFGEGLDVGWLQEPRYAGTVSGHFQRRRRRHRRATLTLTGGGRLTRADLFNGTLSDADVSIGLDGGTLRASFDGRFADDRSGRAVHGPAIRSRR